MKIAVVGANGNLGSRVVRQALERGHEVTAIMRRQGTAGEGVRVLQKSLFDLTRTEVAEVDVLISAFGGGFKADPSVNKDAFLKCIELVGGTQIHLIAIGGAGSLYTDGTHGVYEYETPEHPEFLREISRNIKLGIDALQETEELNWTVVCPARNFDPEGPFTGDCLIGTDGEVMYNEEHDSYVTYEDLAKVMVDIAEQNSYKRRKITAVTRRMRHSCKDENAKDKEQA